MFIVYVIDTRFPKAGWKLPGVFGKDYTGFFVTSAYTIPSIVDWIKKFMAKAGKGKRSIDLIRLGAHGNSGYLQLGTGIQAEQAKQFADLAEWMVVDAYSDGVEIHGCGVGSNTNILGPGSTITNPVCVPGSVTPGKFNGPGYDMLKALASSIKRNVRAGVNCQYADPDWKFEGPTVTVNPNGSWGLTTYK